MSTINNCKFFTFENLSSAVENADLDEIYSIAGRIYASANEFSKQETKANVLKTISIYSSEKEQCVIFPGVIFIGSKAVADNYFIDNPLGFDKGDNLLTEEDSSKFNRRIRVSKAFSDVVDIVKSVYESIEHTFYSQTIIVEETEQIVVLMKTHETGENLDMLSNLLHTKLLA